MKKDLKSAFGVTLKQLRISKKMTQDKLAGFAGIDRSYISDLERGLSYPSLKQIFKFAEVLKIRPSEFIKRIEEILAK